jgi:predicted nucleic-acid-binding protein
VTALDTNVLVRLLTGDDTRQAARARALVEKSAEPLFVPLTVALELEWVLRARYACSRDTVILTFVRLLETRELDFQEEASVERAIFLYRSTNADLGECLHAATAITHERAPLKTFDRKAARLEGVELL